MKKFWKILASPITKPIEEVRDGVRIFKAYRIVDRIFDMFQAATASHERSQTDPMSKSLFASKTFWWNITSSLAELMAVLPLPPGTLLVVQSVINIVLRFVTTKPVHVVVGDEPTWSSDNFSKSWLLSKTFQWNVLVAILELSGFLPLPPGVATAINGGVNILLRFYTTKAVHA